MFIFAAVNGRSPLEQKRALAAPERFGDGGRQADECFTPPPHRRGQDALSTHYVTFRVDSGDRIELCASEDNGMLVEGDRGMLHFQGTRYLGFDRRYPQNQGEMQ